ncbi:hypothetical protein SEA_LISARA_51 [Arthrobacter phage LiSara]|uniref:Uncharacterized protein n=2 Tax=Laroyevirus TaxID=1982086 RepID=A0A0U4JSH8_9CAUD|nr:hypothetical protein FDH64_gp54 [Arthrobacter phage Laroye]YP_010082564.1 hypothetical protein KMD21_gp51 [Arthrobacter phage LiSara]ALY09579.1 hypothetical protein LAROYE_54 [Arthrobacter phage Laroye]ASR83635.1 hypothetical protein SEA_LISARA_51 [Arthrobacter phage LiSara]
MTANTLTRNPAHVVNRTRAEAKRLSDSAALTARMECAACGSESPWTPPSFAEAARADHKCPGRRPGGRRRKQVDSF